nr:putative capsid protein [Crucivirus sp.]
MPQVRRAAPARKVARPPARRVAAAPARRAPARRAAPAPRAPKKRSEAGGAFRSGGSVLGGMLGTALGGPAGGAVGGLIGRGAGAMFSKLLGHGDYTVSNVDQLKHNNIALSNAAQLPIFGSGKVACKFVHREFLGDVYSSATPGAFKIDSYPINPGQSETFPWLSGVVGAKFQQYRINGLSFEFRSMSSDALNSTNTALGSVIMSTDYDSADNVFTSKQEMENTEYGVSCKPSANMLHGIECERFQTPVSELYIRAFDVPAGKDIRLYDLGRFSIATVGCQGAGVNLGELWATYDIDAFKAIEQPPQYLTPVAQYKLVGVDATHALGTSQTQTIDQIGVQFEYAAGVASVIMPHDMPPGSIFSFYWAVYGASTAAIPPGDVPVISPSLDALGTGNGWQGYSAMPYPTTQTSDAKGFYSTYKYDGTGTPSNPPKLSVAGGVVPATITVAGLTISMMSALTPADGLA